MTAKDLIATIRSSGSLDWLPANASEPFLYMAAHAHEFRLANGGRLLDLTDFISFLLELAEALKPDTARPKVMGEFVITDRVDRTCPRCGHIHEGDRECGAWLGAGRFCRCELEVPA